MKRNANGAAAVALAGLVLLAQMTRGPAQTTGPGPGQEGSVLKDPFAPAAAPDPAPAPASSPYVESLIKPAPQDNPNPNPANRLRPPEEKPDINQDIHVTKEQGPWLIMVQAYTGPEAPIMARQMVTELRTAYKLPAYTFNYGADEKRKEYERVKAVVDKQKEYLAKMGLPLDQPIRIRTMHIEEQVGVLVGGYASEDAAKNALINGIRKLKPPDPNKVMLDKKFYYEEGKKKDVKAEMVCVDPFQRAFVVHNPTIKQERPADWDKLDMGLLQKLNAGETFSLLNSKKPFTLAVKDFQTPTIVQTKNSAGSFLENLTLGAKMGQRVDAAATSAHNLAELLRKAKLDAYVLHTKYTSIVCVGAYDSLDDPSLRTMANLIESKVMPQISQLFPPPPNQAAVQARVVPMQVPK